MKTSVNALVSAAILAALAPLAAAEEIEGVKYCSTTPSSAVRPRFRLFWGDLRRACRGVATTYVVGGARMAL
jgi:hypothetical protein